MFVQLIDELASFAGEYREIVFEGVTLTLPMFEHLFQTFAKVKCLRALEVVAFDGFHSRTVTNDHTEFAIREMLKRFHCLRRVSISGWTMPIFLAPTEFMYTSFLTEGVARNQDMTQPMKSFVLPANIARLDLGGCHFTFGSLRGYVKI